MKKPYTSVILLLIAFTIVSQEAENKFTYRHFEGTIEPYQAQMNMQIINDQIYGCAYLQREGYEPSYTWLLHGYIDSYGIAELEVVVSDELEGYMAGNLGADYQGFYRPANSQLGRDFNMKEAYTESIRFEGYMIKADSVLFDSAGSPHASVDLSILLPESVDSNTYIRESVLKTFFGNSDLSSVPDGSVLLAYSDIYFNKYIESNIDIYDGGHSFDWEMVTTGSIILNQKGILCYQADSYGYTGGAHGMGISRFLVFDTRNKTQLSLEDIFIDNHEEELGALLEEKYRRQMFLAEDESLLESGLFEEHIPPSENFWLTGNGIGFFYNPYQLAPYSMGPVRISLSMDEIRHLLREDAAVKRLGW